MSASRSFIDVLVGKLTAYVDASSRPTSDPAVGIQTPWWVSALDPSPVSPVAAARAYAGHAIPDTPAGAAGPARTPRAPIGQSAGWSRAAAMPVRTPAQRAAIQLLRRLGADDIDARSSDAALRSACRRLLRACHPDTHPHLDDAARAALTARLRAVIRARDVLALPAVSPADAALAA